ncbi:transposase family protein [Ktedonobacter sp. SOSP1-85]|uniref:transposase family protein n=1 Tax=Ktedonobacter sp. SOSP1-85 TaxID=2778367 RepID=UPI00191684FB
MQEICNNEAVLTVTARTTGSTAFCPTCGQESHRLHSYYMRRPADLPVSGQAVCLRLHVRCFRCLRMSRTTVRNADLCRGFS